VLASQEEEKKKKQATESAPTTPVSIENLSRAEQERYIKELIVSYCRINPIIWLLSLRLKAEQEYEEQQRRRKQQEAERRAKEEEELKKRYKIRTRFSVISIGMI
jgi:hypothetical protein